MDSRKRNNQFIPVQSKQEFAVFIQRMGEKKLKIPAKEVIRDPNFFPADIDDLYRLYRLVRDTVVLSVIEYGAGWSTLALSQAIWENRENFCEEYIDQRNLNAFQLHTVDASKYFLESALNRIPDSLQSVISPRIAIPRLVSEGENCTVLWSPAQRVDYDLIYIDGPEPEQVVRGEMDFPISNIYDLPIMGDMVRYESYILPSTLIMFDGRTSNYRHFKNHFSRDWISLSNFEKDYSLMYLNEDPIGSINKRHLSFREERAFVSLKEFKNWGLKLNEN